MTVLHQDLTLIQTKPEIAAGVLPDGKAAVADHGQGPVQLLAVEADGMADHGDGAGGQAQLRRQELLHRHEAIDVGQPGVQGIVGPEGGRQGELSVIAPAEQGHKTGLALGNLQIPAVVPQGEVGLAVFRVGLQTPETGRQIVSSEIGPQAVAVAVGFVSPFLTPQKVPLIGAQLLGIEMVRPQSLLRLKGRLRHHHLEVLQLQPFPLGQLNWVTEPADDKEQLLPGLQRSSPHYRVGLGGAGEMGDAHLGQGDFLPLCRRRLLVSLPSLEKFLHASQSLVVLGLPQPTNLGLTRKCSGRTRLSMRRLVPLILQVCTGSPPAAGFIGYQRRGRGFQTQIEKGLEIFQGAGAVAAADQERLNLGIIEQVPEQFPQTIAVEGAEDGNGRSLGIKINPGQSEALHDIIHLGPRG